MREVTAKKVILKDLQNNYVIPYTPIVTADNDGLMTSTDKKAFDTIVSEFPNKLEFSNLQAGNNIEITQVGDIITISSTASGEGGGGSSGGSFDLTNYYTKQESNNLFASKKSEHTHANKTNILDLFTLDEFGMLKWNGKVLPISPKQISITDDNVYSVETEVFNIKQICSINKYGSLTNIYLFISNKLPVQSENEDNVATVSIYNNNILLDAINLDPGITQGYQLPAIFGLTVKIKGTVYSELSITGYGN